MTVTHEGIPKAKLDLFNNGLYSNCYEEFGAHIAEKDGVSGFRFAVWAPGARSVRVTGDFCGWKPDSFFLSHAYSSGVWIGFVPGCREGDLYKFIIESDTGEIIYKADPYAFSSELRPGTASRLVDIDGYRWHDFEWMSAREKSDHKSRPLNIYEVHLGSWKQHDVGITNEMETDAARFYSYREIAAELVPYVKEMGYTHVEILPVMEYPFDGSWGYQPTGYFAPTSRYGSPKDFMYLIDSFHQAGIGVILDWVPGHFCKDAHGLGRFNGHMLYEAEEHEQWGTYKFDFGRHEVVNFLMSSAGLWLDKYHVDGLRFDGVSSMLYLNFGIDDPKRKRKNREGGEGNLEAIAFLQNCNKLIGQLYPSVFTIAEESTAWPLITYPPEDGGLGFHYKWDMGWMNDTLKYMHIDFPSRPEFHSLLTFSMMYAFSENFILALSHDEVVHGKLSLIGRMPGDYWRQFANMRILYLYQMTHPGGKLNFMGNEIGQFIEWRFYEGIEWFLLDYDKHRQYKKFVQDLNNIYVNESALWENNYSWDGYRWIDADNSSQCIISYCRIGKDEKNMAITVINFRTDAYEEYEIGVPLPGYYRQIISSDEEIYGGSGRTNNNRIRAVKKPMHGYEYSIKIKLPAIGGVILKKEHRVQKSSK